jgi:hypothetical protein
MHNPKAIANEKEYLKKAVLNARPFKPLYVLNKENL